MKTPGELALIHLPADVSKKLPEAWLSGPIHSTIAGDGKTHALHIVNPLEYKPDGENWRRYDGAPQVLAREKAGIYELEFLDTWPRTHQ